MKRFEVGNTYKTRSICDYDCIFSWTVLKRTEKTLTLKEDTGEIKTRRIAINSEGIETCRPDGKYSMCPVIRANKMVN